MQCVVTVSNVDAPVFVQQNWWLTWFQQLQSRRTILVAYTSAIVRFYSKTSEEKHSIEPREK